jgi:hypothetical protein
MKFSRFLQIFLGVSLAFSIVIGGGAAIAVLMMSKLFGTPPKPMFTNDYPPKKPATPKIATAKPSPKPTPKASPTPTSSAKPSLEPGAFEGRVTWPEGLSLRDSPTYEAGTVGGLDYNTPVVVLEESPDGVWQKIRLSGTGEEGWIKAGNVEKASPAAPTPTSQ